MRLFLIRHAECQHNVGQALYNRRPVGPDPLGCEQAMRLARYFRDRPIRFNRVLSSDLSRATQTARIICRHQLRSGPPLEPFQTAKLRERCFGCGSMPNAPLRAESVASMKLRINGFLRDQILPLMADRTTSSDAVIGLVAHGMILQVLWSCLADLFGSQSFHVADSASTDDYMHPVWSNTGVMEVDIRPGGPPQELLMANALQVNVEPPWLMKDQPPTPLGGSPSLIGWSVTILAVDSTLHLEMDGMYTTRQCARQTMDELVSTA
ncbi:uncharacterized protein N7477_009094 [Penicillium maclennaniae]|uniref:uncharacterized protein n=1 Tax=Penicillium maclennaniae TaxID=1343394 RepID=UPI002541C5C3|nr:uncharacterized protein N7477_009094 [Penicillium maclennaniae]KAJ5661478.1 hypothetical protein N7477_009094 [Penicillium maclennaniae]